MHKLQKILLKRLALQNNQRYATLTSGYDFEDNIVFHLNQLLISGLIEKNDGIYTITTTGIKQITSYEPFELENHGVKTFFIGFVCSDAGGNFLLKSHPQAQTNFYNLPSGKPVFGESMDDALKRTFFENTSLQLDANDFAFYSLHMKTIQTSLGEVLFDDAFTIFTVKINNEQKDQIKLIDSITWYTPEKIRKLPNRWPEIDLAVLEHDTQPYRVYTHISDYIL